TGPNATSPASATRRATSSASCRTPNTRSTPSSSAGPTGAASSAACSRPRPPRPDLRQQQARDHLGHDLVGPATDAEDARVAVVALDLALAPVAHAAVELHGVVDHAVAGEHRGVLGHGDLLDHVVACLPAFD